MKLKISFLVLLLSFFSVNGICSEDAESIQAEINQLHSEKKDKEAAEYAINNIRVIENQYGVKSWEYANYLATIGGLYAFANMKSEANKYFFQASTARQQNRLPLQPPGIGIEGYKYMMQRPAPPSAAEIEKSGAPRSFSDLNRDGKCDQIDLDLFNRALNVNDLEIADFDRDGRITENDKTMFMQFWNSCKRK